MKKTKKYQVGVNNLYSNTGGWSYGFGQNNSGIVNPGNQALKQFKTVSPSSIPTGALPASGNISQLAKGSAGKAGGGFLSGLEGMDIGGMASSLGSTLAMMINANKKDPNPGRPYKKGSKMIKYQTGTDKIIGPGPLSNLPDITPEELKAFNAYENQRDIQEAIQRVNPLTAPISPLTPKMASIRMPQQAPMSPRLNKVPVEKQSRRERKAENERLFKMVRKNESPIEPLMPKMVKISPEIPAMQPSLKKVEVETPSKRPKFFDYHSAEAKGGYARALKSGIKTKEGWLTDPETGLVYKDLRGKSSSKSRGVKPSVPPAGQELVRMSRMGENPLYNKSVGVPEPIKRNYPKKIDKENFQPIGLGEKYQAGTKSLTKDEGKVGKGSEYFALAKTLTPEQKAEFRKLDAQAKKEGKTFSFQGLKYDPAAYAAAMSKGKGASKGGAKADTPKTAQHTTDDPGKKMKNSEDLSSYAFGEKPITFMGDAFSIRPSTLEKVGKRGAAVLGSLGWGPLAVPTLGAVGTASLIDAVNELTPRGSNFETYLSNLSKTLDIGASLAGAAGTAVGVGKGLGAGYGAVKNPREALKKIKELWSKRMQTKATSTAQPAVQATVQAGRRSGKLGSTQGFNQNPLQTP